MSNKPNWDFWSFLERFKIIAELIAAMIVITPMLLASWQFVQQGLKAVVPAWYVLFTAVFAVILGLLLGWGTQRINKLSYYHKEPLQKIVFEANEYPTSHGWKVDGFPRIEHRLDGFAGNVLDVAGSNYTMDFAVSAPAEIGTGIEFMAQLGVEARISVLVLVQSRNTPQSKELWLTFVTGKSPPKRVDDVTRFEYEVCLLPIRSDGQWHTYRVNLGDAFRGSAGKEGWRLERLKVVRVRGSLSLSYFSVLW
jgi:hypothetical protein